MGIFKLAVTITFILLAVYMVMAVMGMYIDMQNPVSEPEVSPLLRYMVEEVEFCENGVIQVYADNVTCTHRKFIIIFKCDGERCWTDYDVR